MYPYLIFFILIYPSYSNLFIPPIFVYFALFHIIYTSYFIYLLTFFVYSSFMSYYIFRIFLFHFFFPAGDCRHLVPRCHFKGFLLQMYASKLQK